MRVEKLRAAALQLKRFGGNLIRTNLLDRHQIWPYFGMYYVTYRCPASCKFCSRVLQVSSTSRTPSVDLDRSREILVEIRKLVPGIYITGGEPLIEPDIEAKLEIAKKLGFYPIALNTTAILLDKRPRVLELVDLLVVSLHTTDPVELARTYNVKRSLADRALHNIKVAARDSAEFGTEVMVNCVLTENNIGRAHEVLNFCLEHGITLAMVPAIVDHNPTILTASAAKRIEYVGFINRAIAQKKLDPSSIQGSLVYLKQIQKLERVKCRPSALFSISPDGRVIDPCDASFEPISEPVDPHRSVESVLREHFDFDQQFRPCPQNCLKACYTQPALAMTNLSVAVREYLFPLR